MTEQLQNLNSEELVLLNALLEEQEKRKRYRKLDYIFPETGPRSRDKYPRQMEFFKAGKDHKVVMFMANNQGGKTFAGMYQAALHLTGLYPDWWEGERLEGDVDICILGNKAEHVRDVLQAYLYGDFSDPGTGFIPRDCIIDKTCHAGVAQALDTLTVRRPGGFRGKAFFKAYSQGVKAVQSDRFHHIVFDEEPEYAIWSEAVTRTATTDGHVVLTFTPLAGYSQVVEMFTDGGLLFEGQHPMDRNKYVVRMNWDEVPHISKEAKEFLWNQWAPHERDARSRGIPSAGEGAVFETAAYEYVTSPFKIPEHWPRAYGLDPGVKCTAAVWAALDPESGCYYIYSEHYQGHQQAPVHANAIMYGNGIVISGGRAPWIRGAIDPAATNRTTMDAQTIAMDYKDLGLDLVFMRQARDAGLLRINNMLASGQLKIFSTCINLLKEMNRAIRDSTGKIKDQHQYHATDALRYVLNPQLNIFRTYADYKASQRTPKPQNRRDRGASSVTGY